jgi:radical SAM protein with 4Fe4S-binding SPASM domain
MTAALALRHAQVLVSDHCNHACAHCYQVHGQKGEMDLPAIVRLFDELARAGVLFLVLSGGEATLRPDLPEILRAARARGFAITLMTNGYALSDALHAAIVATGVWRVRISIYSDLLEEHDAVTRVPGSFVRTCANIQRLRAAKVQVDLTTPMTSFSTATVPRLRALGAKLTCPITVAAGMTAKEDGSLASLAVAATPAQLGAFFTELEQVKVIPSVDEKKNSSPCGVCTESLTVHSDGSVRACTHIPGFLSKARGGVASAMASPSYQFVGSIRWRDLHGCRDCALLPYCSRCHGSAAFEAGDMLGPQPSACRSARVRYETHHSPLETLSAVDPAVGPRDANVGPFELVATVSATGLRPIADVLTERDHELGKQFPWVRRATAASPTKPIPTRRLLRRAVTVKE